MPNATPSSRPRYWIYPGPGDGTVVVCEWDPEDKDYNKNCRKKRKKDLKGDLKGLNTRIENELPKHSYHDWDPIDDSDDS